MIQKEQPIGVFDAGVGGFTVVKELQKQLPHEKLVYYADSKNMPYGNRDERQILYLTRQILDFLQQQNVKAAVVACNTISTLINKYRDEYPFRVFSVVQAGSETAAAVDCKTVGMLGTVFTAQSGCYERLIHQMNPKMKVIASGCPELGRLIDSGHISSEDLHDELTATIDKIMAQEKVGHLILGCTHYPIVKDEIKRLYPWLEFINPAYLAAVAVRKYLEQENAVKDEGDPRFIAYTTGDPELMRHMAGIVQINLPDEIHVVKAPALPAD